MHNLIVNSHWNIFHSHFIKLLARTQIPSIFKLMI